MIRFAVISFIVAGILGLIIRQYSSISDFNLGCIIAVGWAGSLLFKIAKETAD